MIGGGAAAADEIEQFVVVVALRARLDLLGDVARHGGRLKDAAHRRDAGGDGLAVLRRRQIVRVDGRRLVRIGGFDFHVAAALRPQQHAIAGHARVRRQLAADGAGREQRNRALRIGRCRRRQRAQENRGRHRRDGEIAAAREDVVQAVGELAAPVAHRVVERDRLLAAQDDAAGNMVVEIVADARRIGDHRDAQRLQERRRAEPGKLQELRRIERARSDDHLDIGAGAAFVVADKILDAGRAPAIEQNARGERLGNHLEIGAPPRLLEIAVRGRGAHAVAHGGLVIAGAFLHRRR